MQIGNVNLDEQVLVVAEIGNNHEGNFDVACQLVEKAAECGAGAVKFQTFQTRYFGNPIDQTRYQRLLSFELTHQQWNELHRLAKSLGLLFLSTPLDLPSVAVLEPLVDAYKIASGDNNFYPLIERVCQVGKPVIVSSGLSDLEQITKSTQFIENQWRQQGVSQQVAVLHCVTAYPAPLEQINLAAIRFLADQLQCTVGYSDHTLGVEVCVLAVAAGARIIEKHFTLDKDYSEYRDHQLSADLNEMKTLVERVAVVDALLGQPAKRIQPCEESYIMPVRRSIVAAADLPAGHRLALENLLWMRPGDGLPPGEETRLVGRTLKRAVPLGQPITLIDLE